MAKTQVLILLGPPGSGKGTQAKEINKQRPQWVHISTGDLFRKEIASGSALGQQLKVTLAAGNLVSDNQTNEVFKSQALALKKSLSPQLFILDGYPRTGPQGAFLKGLLNNTELEFGKLAVLELKVNEEAVVERLSGRLMNPRSGKVYHVKFNPPQKPGICDEDGGPLTQRDDDKEEVIRARFGIYKSQKDAILNSLKDQAYMSVEGEGKPTDITKLVLAKIKEGLGLS